ncbi:hypothetical protein SeMB42_g02200 [Synchytrium endobioticum]|uniref:Coatomer subunit delta n=1 Tax=Synchytrium endobioticum TaxID=286115 RepID=A0A507D0C2_9FUNG|nr:hypothetical protein SeLEV6574_g04380 [Synchytrium endobioticum]TPX50586.1 hypothetical protein SeMB42_g02200 [Synchytrium endobioticum]
MVVLAASICTKGGKAILSRQFVEMPQSRIEGLLASFPKLINSSSSDQHTFIETDSVRYVYQPLEETLYMVLVTNRQSNILQDIDTLHLFARSVAEYCPRSVDEREIGQRAFDLLMVFDEIVALGYRETVSMPQIRTIMEMESHEERVQAEIERNKEKEAREERNRKARALELQKREMAKKGYTGGLPSSVSGFGSSSVSGSMGAGSTGMSAGGVGMSNQRLPTVLDSSISDSYSSPRPQIAGAGARGMQLGRKNNSAAIIDNIKAEEGIEDVVVLSRSSSAAPGRAPIPSEGLHIMIEEKLVVAVNRDGGLQNMEVKGEMLVLVTDEAKQHLKLNMMVNHDGEAQFKTHPNVDKKLFTTENIVSTRDGKPFPLNQQAAFLKWRLQTKDDSAVPLSVNCWPSPSGTGNCDVNMEYELQRDNLELVDVVIAIPYPGSTPPTIGELEGSYRVDRQKRIIEWQLPVVDASNKSGVLEFSVQSEDVNGFYPIHVSFRASKTFCDVAVINIVSSDDGSELSFSKDISVATEEYKIV